MSRLQMLGSDKGSFALEEPPGRAVNYRDPKMMVELAYQVDNQYRECRIECCRYKMLIIISRTFFVLVSTRKCTIAADCDLRERRVSAGQRTVEGDGEV